MKKMMKKPPAEIAQALLAAGFRVPSNHPLVAADGSLRDPRADGYEVIHTGGGCMSLYREYGRFYIQISLDSGDGFDLEDWQDNLIGVYECGSDNELTCVYAPEWQEIIDAAATCEETGVEFYHAGTRWSFDGDQLAVWDAVEGHFEFHGYHRLAEPTVESVKAFIDTAR